MSPAEQREEAVFEAALKLSAAERPGYLDTACAGDAELRRRVEVLLNAFGRASGFMKEPAQTVLFRPLPLEKPGDRIGRYKLLEQIGEGGCGVVYVAEQQEPVRRRVALKIIKLGMDTKQVIARFDAERQALAMMDHPNIAKIFDAGITEGRARHSVRAEAQPSDSGAQGTDAPYLSPGRPYFVMELVRGVKITDYCNQNRLSSRERLDLFIQVCRAIQHAHQKGVIHRDIKPSNVLVASDDGVPVPKVIDFGIAKATQGRLTDQTVYTAFEQFIGTPAYMSPEQAALSLLDIDTRSDIYSLGVLLYELLTGTTPFDAKELLSKGLDEMRRIIREVEPVKPSTRLTQTAKSEIRNSKSEMDSALRTPHSAIPSDLDWIVMKCLEKDRTRRYETANGLAQDVVRHLKSEPVIACPPTSLYRFRKAVQRNKLAFAAGGAVAASLVVGLTLSTVLFFRERAAREEARQQTVIAREQAANAKEQQAVAQAVNDFLQKDLLRQADSQFQAESHFRPNPNLTVREALERAAAGIGDRFKDQPLQEAAIRFSIGETLMGVGEPEKAIPHLQRSIELRRAKLGTNHQDRLEAMNSLVLAYYYSGKRAEALPLCRETLELRKANLGPDHDDTLDSMNNLALLYEDSRSVALMEKVFELVKARNGPDSRETLRAMKNLAESYNRSGERDRGLPLLAETLRLLKAKLGTDDMVTLRCMHDLAVAYEQAGTFELALPLFEEAFKLYNATRGPAHPDTLDLMDHLVDVFKIKKDYAAVETWMRDRMARMKQSGGSQSGAYADALTALGEFLLDRQQWSKAESSLRECLEIREKIQPDDVRLFTARSMLGTALLAQAKYTDAEPLLLSGYQGLKQGANRSSKSPTLTVARECLARLYEATDRAEQARLLRQEALAEEEKRLAAEEKRFSERLQNLRSQVPADDPKLDSPLVTLTQILIDQRKYAEAERVAKESLALREKIMPDRWLAFNTRSVLGGILMAQKKYSESEPHLLAGYEGLKRLEAELPANGKVCLRNAIERLVRLYEATGQPDQAADWKQKLAEFEKAGAEKK